MVATSNRLTCPGDDPLRLYVTIFCRWHLAAGGGLFVSRSHTATVALAKDTPEIQNRHYCEPMR
ncbi:hypothetical protein KCP69_19825 [Salmonella enterica subsp. enterica]|nr:hypothetical protein KCP69_19825 [Salmonella enterica subsp. enterica]